MPLCTEKQARAAACILTRNASIQCSQQLSVDSSSFGPKLKKLDKPNKGVSTRKCILENCMVVSCSGEIEVATAANLIPYSLEITPPFLLDRFSYKYGGGL